ncbi:site-specific integrase [Paenibacillus sp. ACRRX]|uniref:site-specific integrase n=1 Tax=Paenibacillus sp. ACRRX TaxID=2918206 RepID=UPI001EF5DACD|nr:site-specific integrase [Paenibacillus sp. ACRRX]MCG7406812.1 site-specific integrase [Paenibacillus sp. ACRRX]
MDFFKVLIETGMRKGEAATLQWTDINLNEMKIDINKTLDFSADEDQELFGDTKTFNSPRIIKISQSLVNDLKDHMKYQNRNKLNLNDKYHHDLNLVLCRDTGNFMPKSSLFNAFERRSKRADLPSVPIHALRHTHAVIMLEADVDMKYLQKRLGHGSIQITSDVYAHISKNYKRGIWISMRTSSIHFLLALIINSWAFVGQMAIILANNKNAQQNKNPRSLVAPRGWMH